MATKKETNPTINALLAAVLAARKPNKEPDQAELAEFVGARDAADILSARRDPNCERKVV